MIHFYNIWNKILTKKGIIEKILYFKNDNFDNLGPFFVMRTNDSILKNQAKMK